MVSLMKDLCVVCSGVCRPRQQCLQCDFCDRWQHRTCRTDVTQAFYRLLVKGAESLDDWSCWLCNLKQTSHLTKRIRTTPHDVTSDLLETDPVTPVDDISVETAATPSQTAHQGKEVVAACPSFRQTDSVEVLDKSDDTPDFIKNVAAYVDVNEPDILPPRRLPSPTFCSSSSSSSRSSLPKAENTEHQISFMYVGDADLLIPKNTKKSRSPSMPRLESHATTIEPHRLPESPSFVTPTFEDVSTSKTPAAIAGSPSSSELQLYFPDASYATLAPPRHLPTPTPEDQPRWSETTESPFPSPPELCKMSTSVDLDTWSPPAFLTLPRTVGPRGNSPLAQLEDRLVKELKL